MSNSAQTQDAAPGEVRLSLIAGTCDADSNNTCSQANRTTCGPLGAASSWCSHNHHRRLAICSIICGLSCIGIKSLIYSVKAKYARNAAAAEMFSRQAKKFGIISIGTWVAILVLTPILMLLISYLLTLRD